MANSTHGIGRLVRAVGFSLQGLRAAWRHEAAFREEVLLSLVLFPCAFWLGHDAADYAILLSSLLIFLITELLNSAVEALTDRVGTELHELSGRAKDLGSAAVFLAFLLLVLVWSMYAWQRLGIAG